FLLPTCSVGTVGTIVPPIVRRQQGRPMDSQLRGARTLVCGASRGLGAACAAELASEGSRVSLVGRTEGTLKAFANSIDATAIPADLSTEDGPNLAVERAVQALGGLDIL